jgi:hypothetical protein
MSHIDRLRLLQVLSLVPLLVLPRVVLVPLLVLALVLVVLPPAVELTCIARCPQTPCQSSSWAVAEAGAVEATKHPPVQAPAGQPVPLALAAVVTILVAGQAAVAAVPPLPRGPPARAVAAATAAAWAHPAEAVAAR